MPRPRRRRRRRDGPSRSRSAAALARLPTFASTLPHLMRTCPGTARVATARGSPRERAGRGGGRRRPSAAQLARVVAGDVRNAGVQKARWGAGNRLVVPYLRRLTVLGPEQHGPKRSRRASSVQRFVAERDGSAHHPRSVVCESASNGSRVTVVIGQVESACSLPWRRNQRVSKPNPSFQKRLREQKKRQKREAKALRKAERKATGEAPVEMTPEEMQGLPAASARDERSD